VYCASYVSPRVLNNLMREVNAFHNMPTRNGKRLRVNFTLLLLCFSNLWLSVDNGFALCLDYVCYSIGSISADFCDLVQRSEFGSFFIQTLFGGMLLLLLLSF
jgi:hypothetical protein